jgi:transcriptional regulator with XRE-family HTH domain
VTDTPGRQALQKYLEAETLRSQNWLARLLGVGQQTVSLWMRGYNRPGFAHMAMIQLVTGISPDLWLTDDERSRIASVRVKTQPAAAGAA